VVHLGALARRSAGGVFGAAGVDRESASGGSHHDGEPGRDREERLVP